MENDCKRPAVKQGDESGTLAVFQVGDDGGLTVKQKELLRSREFN